MGGQVVEVHRRGQQEETDHFPLLADKMKRALERDIAVISAEIKAVEQEQKESRQRLYVLLSELGQHSITQTKAKKEELDQLRKELPKFLFDVLVTKGDPVHGVLTHVYMLGSCGWAGESVTRFTEITVSFSKTGSKEFEINTDDGSIEPSKEIWLFNEPKFERSIEKLWTKAMKTNKKDVRYALAAVMTCVARKLNDPEPMSDFLRTMFDKADSDDE